MLILDENFLNPISERIVNLFKTFETWYLIIFLVYRVHLSSEHWAPSRRWHAVDTYKWHLTILVSRRQQVKHEVHRCVCRLFPTAQYTRFLGCCGIALFISFLKMTNYQFMFIFHACLTLSACVRWMCRVDQSPTSFPVSALENSCRSLLNSEKIFS